MTEFTATCMDKIYIDGPYGSKTLAGVLLARFERVSHVTHSYKDRIPIRNPVLARLGLEFPY